MTAIQEVMNSVLQGFAAWTVILDQLPPTCICDQCWSSCKVPPLRITNESWWRGLPFSSLGSKSRGITLAWQCGSVEVSHLTWGLKRVKPRGQDALDNMPLGIRSRANPNQAIERGHCGVASVEQSYCMQSSNHRGSPTLSRSCLWLYL